MISKTLLAGYFVWGILLLLLFCLRPKSRLHTITLESANSIFSLRWICLAVSAATILVCILPMGLSPSYNGETPDYTNQYELMAESLLDGHLYLDYDDIDPKLLAMENPYDFEARKANEVSYHWDHAFYKGHYYMYFGVVPVFLVFLPYRIITGMNLTTYHATQIFIALFICGTFSLFSLLARTFFQKMSLSMYLMLSAAFSVMSVWYSVDAPALYCTAISAAICLEIWSIFCFIYAVFQSESEKKSILYAFFGSLSGALAFGCRPPIALANIIVIPLLIEFLRRRTITWKLLKQLILAALPYLVIGILLMLYNNMRFDSPFEFGQSYQLTITDQSNYGSFFSQFSLRKILNGLSSFFIQSNPLSDAFPYVTFNGILVNFPILCFSIFAMASEGVRHKIREEHMQYCIFSLFCIPLLIAAADILWAPTVLERYRMDIYWITGILCFLIIGCYHSCLSAQCPRRFSSLISIWALLTICKCFLLYLLPYDYNFTMHFPEKLEKIRKIIMLGKGVGLM